MMPTGRFESPVFQIFFDDILKPVETHVNTIEAHFATFAVTDRQDVTAEQCHTAIGIIIRV